MVKSSGRRPKPPKLVAQVLGITDVALRGRLHYHGIKTHGMTVQQLVAALENTGKQTFTPAQRRQLGLEARALPPAGRTPPVAHHRPPPPARRAPPARVPAVHANPLPGVRPDLGMPIGLLEQVESMILPLEPGHYGTRELLELSALSLLRHMADT